MYAGFTGLLDVVVSSAASPLAAFFGLNASLINLIASSDCSAPVFSTSPPPPTTSSKCFGGDISFIGLCAVGVVVLSIPISCCACVGSFDVVSSGGASGSGSGAACGASSGGASSSGKSKNSSSFVSCETVSSLDSSGIVCAPGNSISCAGCGAGGSGCGFGFGESGSGVAVVDAIRDLNKSVNAALFGCDLCLKIVVGCDTTIGGLLVETDNWPVFGFPPCKSALCFSES